MSTGESTLHYETLSGRHLVVLNPMLADAPWTEVEAAGNHVLQLIREDSEPGVLIDLTELNYISSTMVALVVRIWKSVTAAGGRMVVVNTHPVVEEVLQIAGLLKVWEVANSREQGLKVLGEPRQVQIEQRESRVVAVAAPLMAIVSLFCCVLYWLMPTVFGPFVWTTLILGNASVAAILGLLSIAKYEGGFRVLGGATVAVAVTSILLSQFVDPTTLRAALRNALADPQDTPEANAHDEHAESAHAESAHAEPSSHGEASHGEASHGEPSSHAEPASHAEEEPRNEKTDAPSSHGDPEGSPAEPKTTEKPSEHDSD